MRTVERVIAAKAAHLVPGMDVVRALPRRELRRVGPFVFLDHMGPAAGPGELWVPPHPHVGLQTVTYLFSGEIEHRDSLGVVQRITPGAVNWMTSGSGIVHSERAELAGLHGIQTWVALPHAERRRAPAFEHTAAAELPVVRAPGALLRVIAGRLGDAASPVRALHPLTYVDLALEPGARVELDLAADHELALYVAEGSVQVGEAAVAARELARLGPGARLAVASAEGARAILLGGAPMADPTITSWNFVVESLADGLAEEARWKAGGFPPMPA